MKNNSARWAVLPALILTGTVSFGQDFETISRPDIAAANCPAEWAALITFEPDLWADTNPIGIEPSLDQATTDAVNKYFVSIMASAEHVSTIIGFPEPSKPMQAYFDVAEAKYDLSTCLTLTPAEQDLVVELSLLGRPSRTEEGSRAVLFEAFYQYECSGLAEASAEIFRLDPQSASFQSRYEEIMSTIHDECS